MTLALRSAFQRQIAWCNELNAPFTARVLQRSLRWLSGSEPQVQARFSAVAADPSAAAVPLRWAAALHSLALRGLTPWSALWPPADGGASDAALDAAIAAAWDVQRDAVEAALALPPQTNEVQRGAALLPGLLHVAQLTQLPLALLEIGASAGLNLWCDRWHHAHGAWQWGDATAALVLHCDWRGPPPTCVDARLRIARRAACDIHPVDLRKAGEADRLASFVWADQPERLVRLRTAAACAAAWMEQERLEVESLHAACFVERELQRPQVGQATVLMHSVAWQYFSADEQTAVANAVAQAAAWATAAAPLAWLRFEPTAHDGAVELRCRLWPGGVDTLLAKCHPHGAHIDWLGS